MSLKTLCTDNVGEYFVHVLAFYLCDHGIIHQSFMQTFHPKMESLKERTGTCLKHLSRALMMYLVGYYLSLSVIASYSVLVSADQL